MHSLALVLQAGPNRVMTQQMAMVFLTILPLVIVAVLAIFIVPFWFICKKAGFSPWLSFLYVVPLGNLVLIYVLAFADWKVMPAPQLSWQPQTPYPPQPPYPPVPPAPPQG